MGKDAKIIIGYRCNNNCVFCMDKKNSNLRDKTKHEILDELAEYKRKGYSNVNFLGGEITIRKDCLELLSEAKRLGFASISITTNGRMLSYIAFATKLVKTGVTNIIVSIHGVGRVHDRITRSPGSFEEVIKGIINLKSLGFRNIGTNTTITQLNKHEIYDISKILLKFSIHRAEFIYCYNDTEFEEHVPQVNYVKDKLVEIIKTANGHGLNWTIQNPPIPCAFLEINNNLRIAGSGEISNPLGCKLNRLYKSAEGYKQIARTKLDSCNHCESEKNCEGVWEKYIETYGESEIIPRGYNPRDSFMDTCDLISEKFGVGHRREFIKKISRILFEGVTSGFYSINQKFDFSLSSRKNALRFSFNDYSEREDSYRKYINFFSEFKDHIESGFLREILAAMDPHLDHQTTIGCEIGNCFEKDRLKLYFEDFGYSQDDVAIRLRLLLESLKIDPEAIFSHIEGMTINAIGIDFLYEKKIGLKIYTKHYELDSWKAERFAGSFQDRFRPLDGEFYLVAFRFDDLGTFLSQKLYKVFNINKYSRRSQDNNRMIQESLITYEMETIGRLYSAIESMHLKSGFSVVPVLYSEDKQLGKTDVYFTIMPYAKMYGGIGMLSVSKGPCDYSCIFCGRREDGDLLCDLPDVDISVDKEQIYRSILRHIPNDIKEFNIFSRERADELQGLDKLVAFIKDTFKSLEIIKLWTSGLRLIKNGGHLKDIGITDLEIPIYGHTPKLYDSIVGVDGSFDRMIKNIDHVKNNFRLNFHIVCLRQNLSYMRDIIGFVFKKYDVDRISLWPLVPSGSAESRQIYRNCAVRYSEIIKSLNSFHLGNKFIFLFDFPRCFDDYIKNEHVVISPKLNSYNLKYDGKKLKFRNQSSHLEEYEENCSKCEKKSYCGGIFKEYIDLFGVNELRK